MGVYAHTRAHTHIHMKLPLELGAVTPISCMRKWEHQAHNHALAAAELQVGPGSLAPRVWVELGLYSKASLLSHPLPCLLPASVRPWLWYMENTCCVEVLAPCWSWRVTPVVCGTDSLPSHLC